jgi:hypothetical protein
MPRSACPPRIVLPPAIDAARRLADVRVTTLAETCGLSIPHTVNCLAGRKPAPPALLAALIKLGLIERAEACARELLASLKVRR